MVLEATMLVLDNSEWMRNGDYTPSRWEAQSDAVNIVFEAKSQSHPDSAVGVMTMAGKGPQVLSTLTKDLGKVVAAMHATQISGAADLVSGINVAQLALKHRQDKNQRQRIIVFNGSPISDNEEGLVRLAKRLKKNNVAVDVVSFGEDEENDSKLRSFVDTVNSGENSHLLTIPAGPRLLSDIILDSPILMGEAGDGAGPSGSGGGEGGGGNSFEFGVDPSMDPELAMALRMSLEEEQARQRASEGASAQPSLDTVAEGETQGSADGAAAAAAAASSDTAPAAAVSSGPAQVEPAPGAAAVDESEDAMLQQALALSQQQKGSGQDEDVEMASGAGTAGAGAAAGADEDEDMDEEEAIARAIEMSLKGEGGADQKK